MQASQGGRGSPAPDRGKQLRRPLLDGQPQSLQDRRELLKQNEGSGRI